MADHGTISIFDVEEVFIGDITSYSLYLMDLGTVSIYDVEETFLSGLGAYTLAGTTQPTSNILTTGLIWPRGQGKT